MTDIAKAIAGQETPLTDAHAREHNFVMDVDQRLMRRLERERNYALELLERMFDKSDCGEESCEHCSEIRAFLAHLRGNVK